MAPKSSPAKQLIALCELHRRKVSPLRLQVNVLEPWLVQCRTQGPRCLVAFPSLGCDSGGPPFQVSGPMDAPGNHPPPHEVRGHVVNAIRVEGEFFGDCVRATLHRSP
jgi:hypothetical protein